MLATILHEALLMISSQAHQGSPRLRLPEAPSVTSPQTLSLQAGHQAPSQRGSFDLHPGCGAGRVRGSLGHSSCLGWAR